MATVQAIWITVDNYQNIDVQELVNAKITDVFIQSYRVDTPLASTVVPVFLAASDDTNILLHAWVSCFTHASPNDPTSKSSVKTFCETLATNYPGLAGIHLDYIAYTGEYPYVAGEQETSGTGIITAFVKSVSDAVKTINPNLIISGSVGAERGTNAYLYGQDYAQLSLYLDWQVILTFTNTTTQDVTWVGDVIEYVRVRAQGCKVISGIRTYNSNTPKTVTRLKEEIYSAINNHAKGWAYFKYGTLLPEYPIFKTTGSTFRPVYIVTDYINKTSQDDARVQGIMEKLQSKGVTAVYYGRGPSKRLEVLDDSTVPQNALSVEIAGGSDAGVINEMTSTWFKNLRGDIKVFIVLCCGAAKITGLSWLPRAHDDNYSPSDFTGIANPDQVLKVNGYDYIESSDIQIIADTIYQQAILTVGVGDDFPEVSDDEELEPSVIDESVVLNADGLVEGNKIAVSDYNGEWKVYEIKSTEIKDEGNKLYVQAENIYYELGDFTGMIADITSANPSDALELILNGSKTGFSPVGWDTWWDPGVCEIDKQAQALNIKYKNTLAALRELAKQFNCELDFKVEISNNQITGRYVNLVNQIGTWSGKRIELGHDLKGIDIITDRTGIKTGILPLGKRTDEQGHESYATITTTQWTKGVNYRIYDGGPYYPAPVDKDSGIAVLELEELREKFGVWNPELKQFEHRYMTWVYDSENDQYSLPWLAYDELLKNATPLLNVKMDALALEGLVGFEHERLHLGDNPVVILEDKVTAIPARLIKYERVLNEPENCKYEIGNFLRTGPRIQINNRLFEYPTEYDLIKRPTRGDDGQLVVPDDDYTDPDAPDQQTGRVTWTQYTDMKARVDAYPGNHDGTLPAIVYIVYGESDYVSYSNWLDMVAWVNNYIATNQKNPSYVPTQPSASSGTGTYKLDSYTVFKQINGYYCGPASLQGVLNFYSCSVDQPILAGWAGTTTSGTGSDGLRAATSRAGTRCTMNFTWFEQVWPGWTSIENNYLRRGIPVIVNLMTGPLPNYSEDWGHYLVITGVNSEQVLVADPAKGFTWYTKAVFESAMTARGAIGSFKHIKGVIKN